MISLTKDKCLNLRLSDNESTEIDQCSAVFNMSKSEYLMFLHANFGLTIAKKFSKFSERKSTVQQLLTCEDCGKVMPVLSLTCPFCKNKK